MPRKTETEIAVAVMKIAAQQPDQIATFKKCRHQIPNIITLDPEDRAPSPTRSGEQMWEQQIRNIRSHHEADGNYIKEGYLEHIPDTGYKITEKGQKLLENA